MANELQTKLDAILLDKNTNLLPENLKKNVTVLGITGTLESGSSNIHNYKTKEDMPTTGKAGDICLISNIKEVPYNVHGKENRFNYFYIPDTKRYYFIDEITIEHGFVRIKGRTDVISSFWNFIQDKKCYINRQENVNSKYIVDNEYPVYATRDIDVINIPCDFLTGNSFILTVSGGV